MVRTVGIVIIGNEVLSGKVKDLNGPYLIAELRKLGSNVRRLAIIPDELEEIGDTVRRYSEQFDDVITTGGVGPTHDDRTIEGIAHGFKVDVVRHPELEAVLRGHFGDRINESVLRMADVPRDTELLFDREFPWPTVLFRNVYIMPGIPKILKTKFHSVRERFRGEPIYGRHVYLQLREDAIAQLLATLDQSHPAVEIGSYPILERENYRGVVTFESRDSRALECVVEAFLAEIPEEAVHQIRDEA